MIQEKRKVYRKREKDKEREKRIYKGRKGYGETSNDIERQKITKIKEKMI